MNLKYEQVRIRMKNYELTYLIQPNLSEQELASLQEKVSLFIEEQEGIVERKEKPFKKSLDPPIKKQVSALMAMLYFYADPQKIDLIQSQLKSIPEILRFMLTIKAAPKTEQAAPVIRKPQEPKEEKVELKDIEKKLGEILGE